MLFQILQFTPCLTWLCLRNIPSGRSTPKGAQWACICLSFLLLRFFCFGTDSTFVGYLQMPFEFSRKWLLLMRQILLLPSQYRWYTPCSSVLRKRLRLSLWIIYWRKITLSRTFTKVRFLLPLVIALTQASQTSVSKLLPFDKLHTLTIDSVSVGIVLGVLSNAAYRTSRTRSHTTVCQVSLATR